MHNVNQNDRAARISIGPQICELVKGNPRMLILYKKIIIIQ